MKTKAIKTLALLIVLSLTMSVMGMSAMAASHDVVMNVNNADVSNYVLNSKYTLAEFENDLAGSEHVAFFNFDSGEVNKPIVEMNAAITGSSQTSGITVGGSSTFSRVEIPAGTADRNHNWASGNSSGFISANGKVTFTFPTVKDGLKPVAVGFFMTTHKTGAFDLAGAPEVTYNVGSEKATPTSLAVGQGLAFCGFKAEGRYLTSLTVYGDETNSMRLDDFCVIYAEDIYGINVNNGTTADSPTAYDEDMFYKDFNNSQYSVLFDFDNTKEDTSYSLNNDSDKVLLKAPVVGTVSEISDITSHKKKNYSGGTGGTLSMGENITTNNLNFASGDDVLIVFANTTLTIPLTEFENLKPVAVGYYTSSHKTDNKAYTATLSVATNLENTISYSVTADSNPTALRFCGFKAPAGDYLKTITIAVASGGQNMRVDDICVIYEDTTKIENDIRISADAAGNDALYYVGDINAEDSLYATVPAARGEGADVILAVYGESGKLIKVAIAEEGSMQAAITNLTTVKGDDTITAVKAFVWNKDTLVPVGVNASIE